MGVIPGVEPWMWPWNGRPLTGPCGTSGKYVERSVRGGLITLLASMETSLTAGRFALKSTTNTNINKQPLEFYSIATTAAATHLKTRKNGRLSSRARGYGN